MALIDLVCRMLAGPESAQRRIAQANARGPSLFLVGMLDAVREKNAAEGKDVAALDEEIAQLEEELGWR